MRCKHIEFARFQVIRKELAEEQIGLAGFGYLRQLWL